MKRILFLGVGRRVELVQAFRSAAMVLGKNIIIYGEDISDSAPALMFCDIRFRLCKIKDVGYIDELLRKAIKEQIDLIIPMIDTNLLILAENKEQFEQCGIKVLISSKDMVAICRDKNATARFFTECGLIAPKTINSLEKFADWYPCFIKPKDGSGSINAYKVENRHELETFVKKIGEYIIQPFIKGVEYTVDIFCDFVGNPIYITPRKRLAVRTGEVFKTEIDLDVQIIEECKRIVEKFQPCGPLTVQLIRDQDSIDWFIEINPRFGGGVPLSMKAGVKSPEELLKLLDGENIGLKQIEQEKNKWNAIVNGAIYSRFDQSVRITEGKSEKKGGVRDKVKGVIFDLDDTLYSEKEYVRSGFKAVAEYLSDEKITDELWRKFVNEKPAIDEVLKWLGREDEIEECIRVYREHKPELHMYDGAAELISSLKNQGIKVGIITDGRPNGQRNKIKALGLNELIGFENIIITEELGGVQFRKPCDIAFRIMALRWKLYYENIVYIGDNRNKDFQASRQLGMQSVWFRNNHGLYTGDRSLKILWLQEIDNLSDLSLIIEGFGNERASDMPVGNFKRDRQGMQGKL